MAIGTFYLPALAISSVRMDVEPAYYWYIAPKPDGHFHGFSHKFMGATLMAFGVAALLIWKRKEANRLAGKLHLAQPRIGCTGIVVSSSLAAWSHIFWTLPSTPT